jgi:hypothetical protein
MKRNFRMKSLAVLTPLALLLSSAICLAANVRTVDAGAKWEVADTTTLSELTIAQGASITAAEGRSVTMTVNGVETPLIAGSYKGKIVLTPAKNILMPYDGMGTKQNYIYRAGILVDNGAYAPDQSVAAAVTGGKVDNTTADGVKISSVGELFNGIMVNGNSTYTINKPTIHLVGNGKNDFAGYGAAIRTGGSSKVTVNNARIDNTGAVRTAVWVGDNAETTINNADIEVHNGTLKPNYGWSWVKGPDGSGTVMMEVPWMLGIVGNNRATIAVGKGKVTYNNSHIKAEAWGAMSTDAVTEVVVNLVKSKIEVVQSGYGAYADGNSLVNSSGSTFDVADYGLIMSGGSGIFTDGSVVNSRGFGVMMHGGNKGSLTIDKGSVFNTAKAVIQMKTSSSNVLIDNAKLNSQKGIILEMFPNDDPNMQGGGGAPGGDAAGGAAPGGAPAGGAAAGGAPGAGAGAPGGAPAGAAPASGAAAAPGAGGGGDAPGGGAGGKYSAGNGSNDQFTTVKNANLKGDFVNALTGKSAMSIALENSTVTGAITTATLTHVVGKSGEKLVMQDKPDLYYLIGEVNLTYAATNDAHGVEAKLDSKSAWFVDKTSFLSGLTIAPGAKVEANKGRKLTMTVDGVETPVKAGTYKGKIVLKIS